MRSPASDKRLPVLVAPALAVAALALVSVAALTACGTTYDATLVADTSPATTATVPSGTARELLPLLVERADALAGLMINEGDDDETADEIATLWAAMRDEIAATHSDLVEGFDVNVAACAKAVQFKRAADADKAALNLNALADAYLG